MPAPLKAVPRTAAATRSLYEEEIVKSKTDKDKLRFLSDLLQSQERNEERAETAASKLLPTVTTERDALLTEMSALREQTAKFITMETEYVDLKTNFDAKVATMRNELVSESQRLCWDAQRAENSAKEALKTAQAQYAARGQQILLDFVQKLVEQFSISEPTPESLPTGISPLILTLWGHSQIKAQLMMAYHKSYPEPNAAFRQTLLRLLKTTLPLQSFEGMELPKPIENLAEKIEVLTAQAKRWNVWPDIEREFEQLQIERQTEFLRAHNAAMSAAEHDSAQRGMGRTPIGQQAPVSSVPLSEHGLNCSCKVCGGPPPASNWSGYIPADPSMSPKPEIREEEER
jgi:hypothetical protein